MLGENLREEFGGVEFVAEQGADEPHAAFSQLSSPEESAEKPIFEDFL